jgi:hypothetical protein
VPVTRYERSPGSASGWREARNIHAQERPHLLEMRPVFHRRPSLPADQLDPPISNEAALPPFRWAPIRTGGNDGYRSVRQWRNSRLHNCAALREGDAHPESAAT